MRTTLVLGMVLTGGLVLGATSGALGAPTLRHQVDQEGDFVLIGNTLGHDCAAGTPAPVVGTVGSCGSSVSDSAPDVYWRSDSPAAGQAEAHDGLAAADARSSARLQLPAGATVSYARLYWGGKTDDGVHDPLVTLSRLGGFSQAVAADDGALINQGADYYQSTADVTALVQAEGTGVYRIDGVDSVDVVDDGGQVNYAAWWLVVFFADPDEPTRNLAIFDGLDAVSDGNDQSATLSGFLVPAAGFDAKLGVITYEGDEPVGGDSLRFGVAPLGPGDRLSDGQNPINNFFNGTRSWLGAPVSVVGDLPQLTGTAQSMSGVDLDVVDITGRVSAGQTAADIEATSNGDVYFLGGFITSISTYKPDFSSSTKAAVDVDGGSLMPGDEIEYTIVVANDGNDPSVDTVLTDVLPAGVTYLPGSLAITAGPNTGALTDPADADQGEVLSGVVTVRLGTGANGSSGGSLDVDESTTVVFRVTIDADASGTITNQATVEAGGQSGSAPEITPTDGDDGEPGSQGTDVDIDECETDAECDGPDSGTICVDGSCEPGCRNLPSSGCPAEQECTAVADEIGECIPTGTGGTGGGGGAAGSGGVGGGTGGAPGGSGTGAGGAGGAIDPEPTARYEGGGAACATGAGKTPRSWTITLLGAAFLLRRLRRRRLR